MRLLWLGLLPLLGGCETWGLSSKTGVNDTASYLFVRSNDDGCVIKLVIDEEQRDKQAGTLGSDEVEDLVEDENVRKLLLIDPPTQ